ncbi:MAG: hypothetical protein LBV45_09410 [Xanthomonadaceae bacterium]|jgi:hypothetical protein|nr:hypothetical protein [Xanthomonadaceae bacterium]
MNRNSKIPIVAAVEWLLGGLMLLRRAPQPLAVIGMLGFLIFLMAFTGSAALMRLDLPVPLSWLVAIVQILLAPGIPGLVFAGMIWVMRDIDQGRPAAISDALRGFDRRRAPSLLIAMSPQLVVALSMSLLFPAMLTPEDMRHLAAAAEKLQELQQAGTPPDPAQVQVLFEEVPVWRILGWLAVSMALSLAATMLIVLSMPQILFEDRRGPAALMESFRVCLQHPLLILAYIGLSVIAFLVLAFALGFVSVIVQLLLGPVVAAMVSQMAMMIIMPLWVAGSAYCAWKRLFGAASRNEMTEARASVAL